jgi:DNA processing protein
MPAHDELHARLFLLHAAEPPAPAIHHYVAVHGPVDAVAQIRHGTAPAAVLSEITRPDARIDDDLRALDSGTARLLTPEDGDWPLGRLTGLASCTTASPPSSSSRSKTTDSARRATAARSSNPARPPPAGAIR